MLWEELSSRYNIAFEKAQSLRKEISSLKAKQILSSPEERRELEKRIREKQKELKNAISQLYDVKRAFEETFKAEIAELL